MDIFTDLIQGLQDDLTLGDESSLYPLALQKRYINRAYIKCAGLYPWPETEDALKTSTVNGQNYYDYPKTWYPDSIWKVRVDGDRYGEDPDGGPMDYADFLNWIENNPTATDKKWASQWRRYFISPTPSSNGNNNIEVWGHKVVDALTQDSDVTIWSYSMPQNNEAIIKEATAMIKHKGQEPKNGQFFSAEAVGILAIAWDKVQKSQMKYKKAQPAFYVADMFKTSSGGADFGIGDFK